MAREPRHIDWTTAQVDDRTLAVELTGSGAKDWNARFKGVLAVLDTTTNTSWGDVSLAKRSIKVAHLQPGSEAELRHFLESIVLQANSDAERGAPEQVRDEDGKQAGDADERMAATFRSFAGDATAPSDPA